MFAGMAWIKHLNNVKLRQALALLTKIRLGWNGMPGANTPEPVFLDMCDPSMNEL